MHLRYVRTATEDPPSTSEDSISEGYLESISVLGSTTKGIRAGLQQLLQEEKFEVVKKASLYVL